MEASLMLKSEQNDEVCDATTFQSSNKADYIKNNLLFSCYQFVKKISI